MTGARGKSIVVNVREQGRRHRRDDVLVFFLGHKEES